MAWVAINEIVKNQKKNTANCLDNGDIVVSRVEVIVIPCMRCTIMMYCHYVVIVAKSLFDTLQYNTKYQLMKMKP